MSDSPFARMALLFGAEAMDALSRRSVAIFGVGGVGGHCAEALARCGIGRFLLVDHDSVSVSNINRQAVALHSTIGRKKVDVMRERILDINPQARVDALPIRYAPGEHAGIWDSPPDLVIDAIDTVTAKIDLALTAQSLGIGCVSCMGAGNKLDPTRFEVADLFDTSVCPLCRAMRKVGRARGLSGLRVLYSTEPPAPHLLAGDATASGHPAPGSVVYVTATAGLLLAREAVEMLLAAPERM